MFDEFEALVGQLDRAVEQAAKSEPQAVRLMTHPGVGPITSLAFVLTLGPVSPFSDEQTGGEQRIVGAELQSEIHAVVDSIFHAFLFQALLQEGSEFVFGGGLLGEDFVE